MARAKSGFSKKFVVQIETDSYLDELARDYALQSISKQRKSLIPKKFKLQQPSKIQNRRRQTVSLDRSTEKISDEPNERVVKQSLAQPNLSDDSQDKSELVNPAQTFQHQKTNSENSEQAVAASSINKRRKTVTFGENEIYEHDDFVIRMDRIRSLANISKSDVPAMPHCRKSPLESAHELLDTNSTQEESIGTTSQEHIIPSPKTIESIVSSEKSAGTYSSIGDGSDLMINTDPCIVCPPIPLINFSDDEDSVIVESHQGTDLKPEISTETYSSIDDGQDLMINTDSPIMRSLSPLINFSNDEDLVNVQSTQGTAMEPQFSEVDILMGLNEKNPVILHPCLPPQIKTKKPVPNLLPIDVVQTSSITRRRQSLTAQYLIAAIDEINSMDTGPKQNKATEVTTMDDDICTITLDFDDEGFGKLHYSDSE